MFERFTDRARRVVVLAQEEARLLNHNYIGTEHILLGLIGDDEGVAARALEQLGVDLDAMRHQVVEIIGQGAEPPSGHMPFTPRAKKILELSLREALQLGHNYIGTEHILLGLIAEGEGVGAQVLTKREVRLEDVRATTMALLGEALGDLPPVPREPARWEPTGRRPPRPEAPQPAAVVGVVHDDALVQVLPALIFAVVAGAGWAGGSTGAAMTVSLAAALGGIALLVATSTLRLVTGRLSAAVWIATGFAFAVSGVASVIGLL